MIKLETKRLILREFTDEDFAPLLGVISDPETMKHYTKPYDENGARRWLTWSYQNYREHGFGFWAMILKETGEFLGDCGVTMQNIDGEILPEIGYHIHRNFWRRGYGSEAARAVRDWAFEHTSFDCLYSYMTADNVASYSTAASVGMKRIKEYEDEGEKLLVYAITREEWERSKNKI